MYYICTTTVYYSKPTSDPQRNTDEFFLHSRNVRQTTTISWSKLYYTEHREDGIV